MVLRLTAKQRYYMDEMKLVASNDIIRASFFASLYLLSTLSLHG